uniref:Uncharacterized protein n=1 Tax=Aegilops tauschii subsp. strangulata TaxID=200361 RepID=A0A453BG80_AEGTS
MATQPPSSAAAADLYETASQPDPSAAGDAYTFLEFNTQGDDFEYPDFPELSQPARSAPPPPAPVTSSASSSWPAPPLPPDALPDADLAPQDSPPPASSSSPSPRSSLYETASQPDPSAAGDAYTFLEFNTQGDDFEYPDFPELSQPAR